MNWRITTATLAALIIILAFIWPILPTGQPILSTDQVEEYLYDYDSVVGRDPIISSEYDLYLDEDNNLLYIQNSCTDAHKNDKFFLHIKPRNNNDLPDDRRRLGFDNLDFRFDNYGLQLDSKCIIKRTLPEYDILHITTGQYTEEEGTFIHHWSAEITTDDSSSQLN